MTKRRFEIVILSDVHLGTFACHAWFDYAICGHNHIPQIKEVTNGLGFVVYMNSGDWVENMTALELNEPVRVYLQI